MPANIFEGLPFFGGVFDFTHMRLMFLAISADRWKFVVCELVRAYAGSKGRSHPWGLLHSQKMEFGDGRQEGR